MNQTLVRIAPFAVYMSFIAIVELGSMLGIELSVEIQNALYPLKILLVTAVLVLFGKSYTELEWKSLYKFKNTLLSIVAGFLVFVVWVNLDMKPFIVGELTPYDPSLHPEWISTMSMILIRAAGAVLIVPVMEELFWRSFLCRYLIDHDFMKVDHGEFTLFSFCVTTILFGLEHNLWLAGMIAGAAYNYIYMKTGSVAQCILSHAISNLGLAIYVIHGGHWKFW